MKKTIAMFLALILCLGMVIGCTGAKKDDGDKISAKIILVDKDEKEYPYDITLANGSTLREALYEAKLIDEDQLSAMFVTTIDGHVADFMEGVTWMVQDENRKQIMGTFDEIFPTNGQTIYLQYYVVPDFD